jgi:hypothetical protein
MIRVTDEIREAAARLLARHNAEEAARVEARYRDGLARAQSLADQHGRRVNEGMSGLRPAASAPLHDAPGRKETRIMKKIRAPILQPRAVLTENVNDIHVAVYWDGVKLDRPSSFGWSNADLKRLGY